jgi:PPM family protein phosphatase
LQSVRFDSFSKSNSVGPNHAENQDSFLVDVDLLFAVADGVGGYSGAKEASSIAVQMLAKNASQIIDENSLADSIREVNDRIIKRSRELHFPNMGTTVAIAKVLPHERTVITGNVGDSPILLFRGNSMESIYADDSHRSYDPFSMYGIIQYLGFEQKLDIHTQTFHYISGDTLLICSDGITDNLLNSSGGKERLVSLVKFGSAEKIVNAALDEGLKPDDMTAVMVFLTSQ